MSLLHIPDLNQWLMNPPSPETLAFLAQTKKDQERLRKQRRKAGLDGDGDADASGDPLRD